MSDTSTNPEKAADINDLQETFSEQQKKISLLKELARKSETTHNKATSAAQEKVKNIAQRLNLLKRKTKGKKSIEDLTKVENVDDVNKDEGEESKKHIQEQEEEEEEKEKATKGEALTAATISADISLPNEQSRPVERPLQVENRSESQSSVNLPAGSDKILFLKQQMEQNRVLLARRASSKQHLEQLVGRLKEQMDTTQQNLDSAAELGRSMNDLSILNVSTTKGQFRSTNDLADQQPFNLEKERIKFLDNRCRLLEKQLENLKKQTSQQQNENSEKDSYAAKLKEMEKKMHNLELEKENREKSLMEENERLKIEIENLEKFTGPGSSSFAAVGDNDNLSFNISSENQRLSKENKDLTKRLNDLTQVNIVLETEKNSLSNKNNHLEAKLEEMQKNFDELRKQLEITEEELRQAKSKVNEIMEINTVVSQTVKTEENVAVEMAKQIQSLQDEISELNLSNQKLKDDLEESNKLDVSEDSVSERLSNFEITIKKLEETIKEQEEKIKNQEEEIMEKSIELNVLNASFKVLEEKLEEASKKTLIFSSSSEGGSNSIHLEEEIQQLKQKLDETNKVTIKLKLKCKKAEKEMENVAKITQERDLLQQKVIELEEEKGQWQLSQVEETIPATHRNAQSTMASKSDGLESKCQKLEQIIADLEKENDNLAEKVSSLEKERETLELPVRDEGAKCVASEISEVQIEEELQKTKEKLNLLEKQYKEKETEVESLREKLETVETKNEDVEKKLENYIHENIELLDKLEKLSKSSSSAESIEIVERLTQQEHLELEKEYTKTLSAIPTGINELTQTDMSPELNESLSKLRDESAELMNKIELFTTERREVLEKMERLTNENSSLQEKLNEVTEQRDMLEKDLAEVESEKDKLDAQLNDLVKEKQLLSTQIQDSIANKAQLDQELSTLRQLREVMPALDPQENASLLDNCEKSLNRLHHELESYRKVNDKNSKFNISKKLAKEAKNAHTQFSQLLSKVREASTAIETVTVFETVVAVTAANGEELAKYEELSQQNQSHAQSLNEMKLNLDKYEKECLDLKSMVDDLTQQLEENRLENENKTKTIDGLEIELKSLKDLAKDFDKIAQEKDQTYAEKIEQLNHLRKELEAKCETYKGEMDILQDLVAEQKGQLIEAYKDHEKEMNEQLNALEERDKMVTDLQKELANIKENSEMTGKKLKENLSKDYDDLQETFKANKMLMEEKLNELSSKQETIDALNQQIIDLYRTMEENSSKVIEKEDEIMTLQSCLDKNNEEMALLRKENEEQKAVVDKLLLELHTHKYSPINKEQIGQMENDLKSLKVSNEELLQAKGKLENSNKELIEKLKKYAANLKKRASQCQELESKLKALQGKPKDSNVAEEEENELVTKLEAKVNELQTALEAKTVQHLNLMESRQSLEKELTQVQKTLEEELADGVHFKEEVEHLNEKLKRSQQQCALNEKELKLLQDTLAETKKQMQKLEDNYKQQEVNLLNMEGIKFRLEQTVAEKDEQIKNSARLEVLENEKALWEKKLEDLREELKNKSLKFDKCKVIVKERTAKIQTLQNTIKDLEEKLSSCKESDPLVMPLESSPYTKEQYEKLEVDFMELSNRYKSEKASFEKTIERLNSLHDGIQAKLQQDMSYIERLEQESEELRNELSHMSNLEMDLKAKLVETENLKEQLLKYHDLQEELKSEKLENENLKEKLSNLFHLEEELKRKSLENTNLQNQLGNYEDLLKENENLRKKLDSFEEELKKKSLENEKLERDLQSFKILQEQFSVISFENENIKAELAALKNLEELLEQKTNEINLLNERIDQLADVENQLKTQSQEMNQLNQQIVDLTEENVILKHDLHVLTAEAEELRAESNRLEELEGLLEAKTLEFKNLQKGSFEMTKRLCDERGCLEEEVEELRASLEQKQNELLVLRETRQTLEQAKLELEEQVVTLQRNNEAYHQDQLELQDLRLRYHQEQKLNENLRLQMDAMSGNYEAELQNLRTQLAAMESLRMQVGQNQTDDQVFIEFENKRLTDLLAEKEQQMNDLRAIINQYQNQNQIQSLNPNSQQDFSNVQDERNALQNELQQKLELIQRLREEIESLKQANLNASIQAANSPSSVNAISVAGASNPPVPVAAVSNENIPPPIFFSSDNSTASIFDEIVPQVRQEINFFASPPFATNANAPAAGPLSNPPAASAPDLSLAPSALDFVNQQQQPSIIEDLQRNVSDLEKHAKDLETKLSLNQQREKDYENKFKDMQMKLKSSEDLLNESKEKLKMFEEKVSNLELQKQQAQSNVDFLDQELQNVHQLLAQSSQKEKNLEMEIQQIKTQQQQHKQQDFNSNSNSDQKLNQNQEAALNMFFGTPSATSEFDNLFGNPIQTQFQSQTKPQQQQEGLVPCFGEDLIQPSKFYRCQDDENSNPKPIEEFSQIQQSSLQSSFPHEVTNQHQQQMDALEKEIETLKEALALSNQQKEELNTKSLKLVKKLKEFKLKNDELMKTNASISSSSTSIQKDRNSFFDGLDAAIEDELKSQIKMLETKLADQMKLFEEHSLEKSKLLKRIDMLVAGNERMTEMKERQDLEVQMYQARIQELQAKLRNLEDWDNDHTHTDTTTTTTTTDSILKSSSNTDMPAAHHESLTVPASAEADKEQVLEKQIQELNAKLEDLVTENEDLKVQIQQQNNLKFKEENLQLVERLVQQEAAFAELQETYGSLERRFNSLTLEKEQNESTNLQKQEALSSQLSQLQNDLESLRNENSKTQHENISLKEQLNEFELEKEKLLTDNSLKLKENEDLLKKFSLEIEIYEKKIKNMEENFESLQNQANTVGQNPDILNDLQEKEAEIIHLKQRIEDLMKEDQTEKLVLEILTKNQEIHLLKLQVKHLEDDKHDLEQQLYSTSKSTKTTEGDSTKTLEMEKQELFDKNQVLEKEIQRLQEEKQQAETELEYLNQHVLQNLQQEDQMKALLLDLDTKNIEIAELRKSLEAASTAAPLPASSQDSAASAVATNWEQMVEERCQQVAFMWQQHLQEKENWFKENETRLLNEIAALKTACSQNNSPSNISSDLNQIVPETAPLSTTTTTTTTDATNPNNPNNFTNLLLEEAKVSLEEQVTSTNIETHSESSSAIIAKMQAALESQEVEIITLKEQLAIRSAEYARLAAQYDPFQLQNSSSYTNSNMVSLQDSPNSRSRAETVAKSELDLALYMLHQRDMRLEEMTLELVKLLEERDTLQLKLSNTIRKLEDIKVKTNYSEGSSPSDEATSRSLPVNINDSLIGDQSGTDELSVKLSQLQSVDHSKDKVIKEEREQRSREMERIQQDVAKIPPAAVYELVGSNPTDSSQSPSSILMNWLWGNKNNDNNASNS